MLSWPPRLMRWTANTVELKRRCPGEDSARPGAHAKVKKLFVGGLKGDVAEGDLIEHFSQFGTVERSRLLPTSSPARSVASASCIFRITMRQTRPRWSSSIRSRPSRGGEEEGPQGGYPLRWGRRRLPVLPAGRGGRGRGGGRGDQNGLSKGGGGGYNSYGGYGGGGG